MKNKIKTILQSTNRIFRDALNLFMTFRLEVRHSAKAFTRLDLNKDNLISRDEPHIIGAEEFFRSDNTDVNGELIIWGLGSSLEVAD